jgi:hypothetical protein
LVPGGGIEMKKKTLKINGNFWSGANLVQINSYRCKFRSKSGATFLPSIAINDTHFMLGSDGCASNRLA